MAAIFSIPRRWKNSDGSTRASAGRGMEYWRTGVMEHPITPSSPSVEVSAGLIFRAGKLLITQRHADSHLGGLWEFPGGKREPGETFEECLTRELQEELGIQVEVGTSF